MFHNVDTIIADLESSIAVVPDSAAMEKHEAELAKAARPPWTADEPFDCEEVIRKGLAGEILPIDFAKLSKGPMQSRETSTAEISAVCADVLRRLASGDDILKSDSADEPEDHDDDEPVEQEPDAEVKKDIAFLKAQCGTDVDAAYELVNSELRKNFSRGKALGKALAYGFKIAA